MLKQKVTIINKLGLHARASMLFINLASRYQSHILLSYQNRQLDAKDILCVMSLGISQGQEIELIIEGEDEQQAMKDLMTLIANKFDEAE